MIIQLNLSGSQIILGQSVTAAGAYLAVGNSRGSQGVIIPPAELDQVIAELERIRKTIGDQQQGMAA